MTMTMMKIQTGGRPFIKVKNTTSAGLGNITNSSAYLYNYSWGDGSVGQNPYIDTDVLGIMGNRITE